MTSIDHVAFSAVRLESAREAFQRLGFALTARGRCTWSLGRGPLAAASRSVMFDRCYLDVIENADPRWRAHLGSSSLYGCGVAPSVVVLRAHGVDDVARRLAERQVGCLAPYDITRTVVGPPEQLLRYRFLPLDRRAAGGLPLAFIHDHDPAGLRRSEWLSHPNGATDLACVTVRVPELDTARRALDAIVSAASGEPTTAIGPRTMVGSRLELVHEVGDAYLAAVAALAPKSERAALLALTFWSDLDATAGALQRSGVRWVELSRGHIGVAPEDGIGCGVVFARRSDASSG